MDRRGSVSAFVGVTVMLLGACGSAERASAPDGPSGADPVGPDPVFPAVGTTDYDVDHYDWDLAVEPDSGQLGLVASLDAVARMALEEIVIDYAGPELSVVTLDGEDVESTVTGGKLVVRRGRDAGENFRLTVEYEGLPESARVDGVPGRFGWIATNDGIHTLAVFPGNTASWVPFNDTPLDPATFEIAVSVPRGYVATASGRLVDGREDGDDSTFEYRVEHPVTEVTVAVGRFDLEALDAGDVHIDLALPARGAGPGAESFADVPRMVRFLVEHFGPLPFPHVGFTYVDGLNADADSTPGRINVRATGAAVLVHELAHQWMGGMVSTASMADSWLREGLPTYVEFLWLEAEGRATVDGTVAQHRQRLGSSTRAPIDVDEPRHRVDDVTYARGALTFHALHAELGDQAFNRGLRHFFQKHAGMAATTEDFIAAMSDSSGRDLQSLFDQWLRAERLPPAPTTAAGN